MSELLRNVPVQARSTSRLQSLREAALEHLDAVGRDEFSTADVAKIAGASIGTVYRYYKNKAAVLDDIWPERDSIVETVQEILERPLPMVTASREKDREALMLEARARLIASGPMLPEQRYTLMASLGLIEPDEG
jgi:AcrR family transcriptional regulator